MSILSNDALEFAKTHITNYYDSDFFPKPDEFQAIWHNWDEVKGDLGSRNIQKMWVAPPRIMTALKPRGGYRVVHQLEPLEAIVYTALAYQVAETVEAARAPEKDNVACSYRLNIGPGTFFRGGTGYAGFVEKTEQLADRYDFLLVTDITDYYNQIYLHRLSNAIEFADSNLKPVGDDIEWFLTSLNSKPSQGIPVGPVASIVMAEAVLVDIDQFLTGKGVSHTRYVDDFRIFGRTKRELREVQEALTRYLYSHHRLTLSGEKTSIHKAKVYVEKQLHNQYAEERIQIFKSLEIFNPYTEELEEVEFEVVDDEDLLRERVIHVINKVLSFDHVDLGLSRSAIRKAKRHGLAELVPTIVENFAFFSPVIADVALYLDAVTEEDLADEITEDIVTILDDEVLDNRLVRFWLEWYLTRHPIFLSNASIRRFVCESPFIENRARAAVALKDVPWVREMKAELFHLGTWERRAILNAARILPSDERKHWLKLTIGSAPIQLDRWVAKWVYDTA